MISESRACSIPNQLDITKRTLRYLAGSLGQTPSRSRRTERGTSGPGPGRGGRATPRWDQLGGSFPILSIGAGRWWSLTSDLVPVVAVLVAPAAALAGVWLSPRFAARAEQRRWQWQRRAEACATVLRIAEDFRFQLWSRDLPAIPKHKVDLDLRPLFLAMREIQLFGEEQVAAAVNPVIGRLMDLWSQAQYKAIDESTARQRLGGSIPDQPPPGREDDWWQAFGGNIEGMMRADEQLHEALDDLAHACRSALRR